MSSWSRGTPKHVSIFGKEGLAGRRGWQGGGVPGEVLTREARGARTGCSSAGAGAGGAVEEGG